MADDEKRKEHPFGHKSISIIEASGKELHYKNNYYNTHLTLIETSHIDRNELKMLRSLPVFLLLSVCSAWIPPKREMMIRKVGTILCSESSESNRETKANPCWQDIYDADCTMDSIFSARFVASEWIKELPCGSGMEVSVRFLDS